ncbi:phosphate ABC transporter substrate-binding protein [Alteromonas sp. SM 2104]|nr:phosphate ABC transporter substrate-binding protein [Alteromonas oceanisediminis]
MLAMMITTSRAEQLNTPQSAKRASVDLSPYARFPGVDGSITSVGSDTLANLIALWSQEFKTFYPHVKFQIQAAGSSTAPPALTEGTATIGPMSRELKSSEINAFRRKYGYSPTLLLVAVDAIAIFVDRKNPLPGLTMSQLDGIFSVTRFCGAPQPIQRWGQLGIDYLGGDHAIRLFGRNSVSGTYGLFKDMALCEGDFRANVNEQPGSSSVVLSVASSNGAMGYAAFGHKTAGVRALPLAKENGAFVPLNEQTVRSGTYPFTRYLYIMINNPPEQPLPTLEREFLRYILSAEGQALVARDGYFQVPYDVLQRQLRILSGDDGLIPAR